MKYLITAIISFALTLPVSADRGSGPELNANTVCGTYTVKKINIGGYDDRDKGRAIYFTDSSGDEHRVDDNRNLGNDQGMAMLSLLTTAYLTGRQVYIASTHSDCRDFSELEIQQ